MNEEKVKIYKCFIASPSDTKEEREICDKVFKEINTTFGQQFNFRVESAKWENASPSVGSEPQDVINKQLFNDINIFIGIINKRFGTPTKNYNSGTKEEFYLAYEKHLDNPQSIEIKMYFNDAPISLDEIDLDQAKQVKEFKELVSDFGGFYATYNGIDDFEQKLRKDLTKYFLTIISTLQPTQSIFCDLTLRSILEEHLNDALTDYTGQSPVWVDRVLCKTSNFYESFQKAEGIDIPTLTKNPYSLIIEAPTQSGLTCLASHLVFEAWKTSSLWVYLDAKKIHQNDVTKSVKKECKKFNSDTNSISCIILDSWAKSGDGMMKILRSLCHSFKEIPIFVMSTHDSNLLKTQDVKIPRKFENVSMLPLTKNKMRALVSNYSTEINAENDEVILNKIVSDLDNLNIHRTPAHCLTLLKISEKYFDESPVNRTKMVSMYLSVLFDFAKYPDYSKKPDKEHCEFILGSFCANMIMDDKYSFSKDEFIEASQNIVEKQKLNLDIHIVFNILFDNHIIIQDGSNFSFKQAFWIYYFAAKRMNDDDSFREFILTDKEYTSFVELIEFYTGINRKQNDLIDLLTTDLQKQCQLVEEKTGLTVDFDPLKMLKWDISDTDFEKSYAVLRDEVLSSNLPDTVKDSYADSTYNIRKPYDQDIYKIYEEFSFLVLKQQIHVCSRALRNSDFVDPDKKLALLNEITRGWNLFSKIFFALSPIIALKGQAGFDGFGFRLDSSFEKISDENRWKTIIRVNPFNIVELFQEDLYSERLSPVFYETLGTEKNSLIKHQLILFLIKRKPEKWFQYIEAYIKSISEKSVHLLDVREMLLHTYRYDYANAKQLADTKKLIKLCYARHEIPNVRHLQDVAKSNRNKLNLPKRLYEDE